MVKKIKLRQPDRSGPSEKTLLEIAEERGLFAQADQKEKENEDANRKRALPKTATRVRVRQEQDDEDDDVLSPTAERVLETMLWTVSLAMLHFTLDVLVQHQFSIDQVQWPQVCIRAVQALMGELPLLPPPPPPPSLGIPHPSGRDSHFVARNGTLLLTVVAASVTSLRPALLPVAPACVQSANPARPSPALPVRLPPGRLLRHEPCCRLPSHPRHKPPWLPGRHEARTAAGLSLGLVRHRAGPALGRPQPCRSRCFRVGGWIQHQVTNDRKRLAAGQHREEHACDRCVDVAEHSSRLVGAVAPPVSHMALFGLGGPDRCGGELNPKLGANGCSRQDRSPPSPA